MAFSYQDFLSALRYRESSGRYTLVNTLGFLGAYQFGEGALTDLGFVKNDGKWWDNDFSGGWTGIYGVNSKAEFLASTAAQDAAADKWFPLLWEYLTALNADDWLGKNVAGIHITASGLIAGAHLLGAGAVVDWLESGGTLKLTDAYGAPISEYIGMFSGYEMPFNTGEAVLAAVADVVETLPGNLQSEVQDILTAPGEEIAGSDGVNDTLAGANGHDVLTGGTGADRLSGNGSSDALFGEGGRDRIYGGTGKDMLFGGAGNDVLSGGSGNDKLYGQAGNDVLNGGRGNDLLNGGSGADVFVFADGFGRDRIVGFDPTSGDQIRLSGVASITGYTDLMAHHVESHGADLLITNDLGDTLVLKNTDLADLSADAFIF